MLSLFAIYNRTYIYYLIIAQSLFCTIKGVSSKVEFHSNSYRRQTKRNHSSI